MTKNEAIRIAISALYCLEESIKTKGAMLKEMTGFEADDLLISAKEARLVLTKLKEK